MKDFLIPFALLAARATVPEADAGDAAAGCAKGLYMVSARGTGEAQGIGAAGSIIGKQVAKKIEGSKVVALQYPATLADPIYPLSVGNGTQNLTELLESYHKSCPDGKIALIGYSQGAHVSLDTVCGSDEEGFEKTDGLPSSVVDNIVAIALFGDPTHIANATYDKGTSKNDGLFPRRNSDKCEKYASKIASWCDTGDVYCDVGDDKAVHGAYLTKYGSDIVQFIVDKYNGKSGGGNSTSGNGPSPTGTTGGNSTITTGSPTATSSGGAVTSPTVTRAAAAGLRVTGRTLYALTLGLMFVF